MLAKLYKTQVLVWFNYVFQIKDVFFEAQLVFEFRCVVKVYVIYDFLLVVFKVQ